MPEVKVMACDCCYTEKPRKVVPAVRPKEFWLCENHYNKALGTVKSLKKKKITLFKWNEENLDKLYEFVQKNPNLASPAIGLKCFGFQSPFRVKYGLIKLVEQGRIKRVGWSHSSKWVPVKKGGTRAKHK